MNHRPILMAAALALGAAHTAAAEEVRLKAVSAFADGTTFTANFERFIEEVNRTGKGVLQIDYRAAAAR